MGHSFDDVYAAHHGQVYTLCRQVVGNRADAQDALQDTFIAVALGLPKFRGESSVRTWVHRIAISAALKVRTRSRRAPEPVEIEVTAPSVPNPGVTRDTRERLARAMDALPFEHRIVIALFAIEGLTHPEIAATLGVPEGTVWSRLHTAKKRLAATLVELGPTKDVSSRAS
jgi:RNA polymerase sigma-70 factor (ECF subfamily)